MHAFIIETNQILTHLQEAYTKILAVNNPDMAWLKNKILQDLKKNITALQLQLGVDPVATPIPNTHTGPLKKILGKDIVPYAGRPRPADVNKPFQQTPADVELAELRLKADELYPRFLGVSSDDLLDSVSDIEIRAVAKRAGLPVTETTPDRITTEYIDQIKAAIREQNNFKEVDEDFKSIDPSLTDISVRTDDTFFTEFSTLDNKEILEVYTDPQIREVAKRAGLPVTEKTPAKIDKKFLDQIKGAIKKQAELNSIAGNV